MTRTYLDYNATAPLRPAARDALLAALDTLGNPSSVHGEGRAARALIESDRADIARAVGAFARNVVFTSGATEAANLALTPTLQVTPGDPPFEALLISAGEHAAVLAGHRFAPGATEILPLEPGGALSLPALEATLAQRKGQRLLLALQAANNETGVLQPVAEAARLVHAAGGALVCDATQAMGRVKTTFASTGADVLLFSSHKLGGPLGAGALVFACGASHIGEALIRGGGQESGRRGGTENVAAIAGFAAALREAAATMEAEAVRLAPLRDRLEALVQAAAPDALFAGAKGARLPNTSAFAIPGVAAQTLLMALDLEGVAVSSGSACSSGKVRASHVLESMGFPQKEALRASLGWNSVAEDVEQFGTVLAKVLHRIGSRRSQVQGHERPGSAGGP